MKKLIVVLFLLVGIFVFGNSPIFAKTSSYITIVNPVRGSDFWDLPNQSVTDAVSAQLEIMKNNNFPATWLIRYDAFNSNEVVDIFKKTSANQEKGLFLEVTPTWTGAAGVAYHQTYAWHNAGSVFLTGYSQEDRKKLIDTAFNKFKETFGNYPKSVGAWYIDSFSLNYMQEKYGVTAALIVADQYSTDNYQIWGQYFSAPFYPSKTNTLQPASEPSQKIPMVVMQWASRDPVNGYGEGVQESTYSVQPNDYIDYHNLNSSYFSKLVDIYTTQPFNKVNQLVVGLENSYSWKDYGNEYKKEIGVLADRQSRGQLSIVNMSQFAGIYKSDFPDVSPRQVIVADDPLGTDKKTVWYMDPYYRAGWFYAGEGSVFRDVRQYVAGQKEPCYDSACNEVNFATFSTRVLDDVTYGQKFIVDAGNISNFKVSDESGGFLLSYQNEAGRQRQITFMARDINIDGKVSSIDRFILEATGLQKVNSANPVKVYPQLVSVYRSGLVNNFLKTVKFLAFLLVFVFIPGYLIVRWLKTSWLESAFLSLSVGLVVLTLASLITGYLKVWWLVPIFGAFSAVYFTAGKLYNEIDFRLRFSGYGLVVAGLIVLGTVFQNIGMFRSGQVYEFGIGFWGPTAHDMVWHLSLINQLAKGIPVENPIFAGKLLSNYHYFYDLLVAITYQTTRIPLLDLVFRFYPIIFSLMLGLGAYLLSKRLFNSKWGTVISLYLVYFGSSFGWIVDYIKNRGLAGESAFWANQAVSTNLNPPFAISLVLLLSALVLVDIFNKRKDLISGLILVLVGGVLIEFKVYGGLLFLAAVAITAFYELLVKKDSSFTKLWLAMVILSAAVFLPQNMGAEGLLVLSPFWFVHSMIDFPDRVGWLRLSQARQAYLEEGIWFKYLIAEGLSLLIFIIGNLGTRFMALGLVVTFAKNKLFKNPLYLVCFPIALLGLLIPLIFIQKGNPWNTIQFLYYFLSLSAIGAGLVWWKLISRLSKLAKTIAVVVLFLMTPLGGWATFQSYFSSIPPATLGLGEYQALEFLRTLPDGTVLTYPFNKNLKVSYNSPYPLPVYETGSYVSAFSEKAVYMEDTFQQEIFQADYKKRLVAADDFFKGQNFDLSKQFLKDSNIKYIYLPKLYKLSLDEGKLNLQLIYQNEEALVYGVLN